MPACGGLSPFPRRMGGGKPRLEYILNSLNAARGTAYDTSTSSTVYAENMAVARELDAAWGTNQRMANQRVPSKMTTSLARWEKILGISPPVDATDTDRRAAVAERFEAIGVSCTHQTIVDRLTAKLGSVFVAVEYISTSLAVITVPDGSYPFGTPSTASPWSSTVAHILIRTQQPTGMALGTFLDVVGLIPLVLEPLVPAWVKYTWYLPGPSAYPVTGGPSGGGFFLDELNLNFEVFGT